MMLMMSYHLVYTSVIRYTEKKLLLCSRSVRYRQYGTGTMWLSYVGDHHNLFSIEKHNSNE